ncbi:MAG TPA: multidrug efflux MFS transporter [Methylomusa anaerophila]|uniref:Tetracycline resistance protein, class B n=1 Tax=Methylomusa anaerophila TaxID=1930071 RepID=A0A348ALV7_9FIRM|nr:multidrug efflux MFS transporter [Methylomusa anaerophila]BBB92055.1 tetracycline resistance protein, class B [Methylomusa anaerophila]HML87933.1 multidrug efflux MFS transporter [Methylomusa anaerophila]
MENWKRNLMVCWFGVLATSAGLSQLTPILPLYIDQLGIHNFQDIERWSGIAYGITFIFMAVFSPLWGQAADKYGRKPMLLRASLGMAVVLTAMGFVQNIYQLVGLRLLQGTIAGFYSASITLIATQTPREHSGWALGTLSTGAVAGMLLGPLLGGYLAEIMGIRSVFFAIGALLLIAFAASLLFVQEEFTPPHKEALSFNKVWQLIPNPTVIVAMFVTTLILQLALMSIQPIITVYIAQLSTNTSHVALVSGMVFAATGLSSILAAPGLGKLADKIGPQKVMLAALIMAGISFIPQAFVQSSWELMGLRFLTGIATAGLLPAINCLVKNSTPDEIAGLVFGYNQCAQFLGSFLGSVLGGVVAATFGIHYVFFFTSVLLLLNATWVYKTVYSSKAACS